jgi:hypothetical protein
MFPLSCVRERGRAAAVGLQRTSLSLPRTFIGLVYSQFELIQIKLKNPPRICYCPAHLCHPENKGTEHQNQVV